MSTDLEYSSCFLKFEKQYTKLPGVMAICQDELLSDAILVYIDRDKFKTDSIPKTYQTFHVDIIDTYEQHSSLSAAFEKIKEHYHQDLSATPVTHFGGMVDFLKVIIELYEAQQGESS